MIIGNNNYFAGHVTVGSQLEIGDMNFIGLNSSLRTGIRLGNCCLVGQMSNVTKSFNNEVVFGNPAQSHGKINKKPQKKY